MIQSNGSIVWGSAEQRSQNNTASLDLKNPSGVIREDGNPVVLSDYWNGSSTGLIHCRYYDGASWSVVQAYNCGSYQQLKPSALFMPASIADKACEGEVRLMCFLRLQIKFQTPQPGLRNRARNFLTPCRNLRK